MEKMRMCCFFQSPCWTPAKDRTCEEGEEQPSTLKCLSSTGNILKITEGGPWRGSSPKRLKDKRETKKRIKSTWKDKKSKPFCTLVLAPLPSSEFAKDRPFLSLLHEKRLMLKSEASFKERPLQIKTGHPKQQGIPGTMAVKMQWRQATAPGFSRNWGAIVALPSPSYQVGSDHTRGL